MRSTARLLLQRFGLLYFIKREKYGIKQLMDDPHHTANRTRLLDGNSSRSMVVRTQNRRCKMMPSRNRPTAVHANEARAQRAMT